MNDLPDHVKKRIEEDAEKLYPIKEAGKKDSGYVMLVSLDRKNYIAGATAEYLRDKWISVKDGQRPNINQYIFTWDGLARNLSRYIGCDEFGLRFKHDRSAIHTYNVIAWQLLPEPPKQ